jgi:hypothetical protein
MKKKDRKQRASYHLVSSRQRSKSKVSSLRKGRPFSWWDMRSLSRNLMPYKRLLIPRNSRPLGNSPQQRQCNLFFSQELSCKFLNMRSQWISKQSSSLLPIRSGLSILSWKKVEEHVKKKAILLKMKLRKRAQSDVSQADLQKMFCFKDSDSQIQIQKIFNQSRQNLPNKRKF